MVSRCEAFEISREMVRRRLLSRPLERNEVDYVTVKLLGHVPDDLLKTISGVQYGREPPPHHHQLRRHRVLDKPSFEHSQALTSEKKKQFLSRIHLEINQKTQKCGMNTFRSNPETSKLPDYKMINKSSDFESLNYSKNRVSYKRTFPSNIQVSSLIKYIKKKCPTMITVRYDSRCEARMSAHCSRHSSSELLAREPNFTSNRRKPDLNTRPLGVTTRISKEQKITPDAPPPSPPPSYQLPLMTLFDLQKEELPSLRQHQQFLISQNSKRDNYLSKEKAIVRTTLITPDFKVKLPEKYRNHPRTRKHRNLSPILQIIDHKVDFTCCDDDLTTLPMCMQTRKTYLPHHQVVSTPTEPPAAPPVRRRQPEVPPATAETSFHLQFVGSPDNSVLLLQPDVSRLSFFKDDLESLPPQEILLDEIYSGFEHRKIRNLKKNKPK